MSDNINLSYNIAKEKYAKIGVDTDRVIEILSTIPISMHCWQGDDVKGFENRDGDLTGGIQVTGSYPGKATTLDELRKDIEKAYSLIPGKHRLNLHASYLDNGGENVGRDSIEPKHFASWVDWAKEHTVGLDFNPTLYSHEMSDSGFTLSSNDKNVREFWIEHCKRARKIGEYFGRELGSPCVTNIWIPDGAKDITVDKFAPRKRLMESLDNILSEKINKKYNIDAVESKLFGIGSESYVVGSHEFYMGYACSRNTTALCLDAGHFHPTEMISNKISSTLLFVDELLLHVSRPVRWDSDHVVILSDELREIAHEIIRSGELDRIHIGLDFFDGSINRIASWVIGMRAMLKALLLALLEPDTMKQYEISGDLTSRLALLEEYKSYPFGAVWDYYCESQNVPVGTSWLDEVKHYEKMVLSKC